MTKLDQLTIDALFAVLVLALIAAGTVWFIWITNERFGAALVAHMIALARGS